MTDVSGYVLETLRKDGEFILYRGQQRGNPLPVLLARISECPMSASLWQLEQESSLAADLDPVKHYRLSTEGTGHPPCSTERRYGDHKEQEGCVSNKSL